MWKPLLSHFSYSGQRPEQDSLHSQRGLKTRLCQLGGGGGGGPFTPEFSCTRARQPWYFNVGNQLWSFLGDNRGKMNQGKADKLGRQEEILRCVSVRYVSGSLLLSE